MKANKNVQLSDMPTKADVEMAVARLRKDATVFRDSRIGAKEWPPETLERVADWLEQQLPSLSIQQKD